MLSSMKIYVPLLWGLCVLFSADSMTTSRPETSSEIHAELNGTTRPATAQAKEQSAILNSTHRLGEVSTVAAPQMTLLTTAAIEKSEDNKTNSSMDGLVTMTTAAATAAATTSSNSLGSTAETTAKNEAQPSPAVTTAASKAQHSPAVTTSANKAPNSPQMTTAPGAAQPSHSTTVPDTTEVAANHPRQPSTASFMTTPATVSTASAGTESVSPPRATSTSPENASELASTSSLENSTQTGLNYTWKLRSPTTSTATKTANPTSENPPHHYPSKAETSTSSGRSSTSHFSSATSVHISSSRFPGTSSASLSSITAVSNNTAGILGPRGPKRMLVPTTRPAPLTTAAPNGASKSSPTQPCSTRGVVMQCLVVIAALAAVATIFAVSTIILCVKLSARKYKMKRPQQATEMMCISSLLPERNHVYTRQRNPITNGVLVFPGGGDSDEDGGDNVTLSSFLPENERYV